MSCYLLLRKWENPQLPAKKQVIKRFGLMVRDPYNKAKIGELVQLENLGKYLGEWMWRTCFICFYIFIECSFRIFIQHSISSQTYFVLSKKGYQNGTPGVLLVLLQMVPFFQMGTLFFLIIMFIIPLRVPYYGQWNGTPRGTVSVPFYSECVVINYIHIHMGL